MVLVPGGRGTTIQDVRPTVDAWLLAQVPTAKVGATVCTGLGLSARNGILDGRRATTNKMAFDWVRQFGPRVSWVPRARWVEGCMFFTASGVSAGKYMSLAVIAKLLGPEKAEEVARITEYTWHREAAVDHFAVELAGPGSAM